MANLKPTAPGIPTCTNASVRRPAALSPAISSKGLSLSKKTSTSDAISVPAPKSINSAPNDTTPSGILINPDAIPAVAATNAFRSESCSSGERKKKS